MRLSEVESGSRVFIDSNIFIYHFTGASKECTDFLGRCEARDLHAVTSANVIVEVLHRLMMIEAVSKRLVRPPNIVKKLNRAPGKLKRLTEYFINAEKIPHMGVDIEPLTYETIVESHKVRLASGLMVNDSLVVASMHKEGILSLASSDKAFEKITEVTLYSPADLAL